VAPIEIEARLLGDPETGCVVEASASARGHDVELEVVLPEGVEGLEGRLLARGARPTLRLDARAPGRARREILVRASVREGDAVLTRVRPLVVRDAPPPPKGVRTRGARGEPVLEFAP
jgi:hypothetical protein